MTNFILISEDMGCAYRLQNNILEFVALTQDGRFDIDDFSPVEPDLVGEENCTFEGVDTNLYGVFSTVTARLKSMAFDKYTAEYRQWCETQDLPLLSADELIVQTSDDVELVTDEQRQWLQNYINRWEKAGL